MADIGAYQAEDVDPYNTEGGAGESNAFGIEDPPAGTPIPAEAVVTSVTVGSDGAYYIGGLRGFPATPGTSQIWRVKAGARGAVCDPAKPRGGVCTRYADGLASIVDLAAGTGKRLYAVSLSKLRSLATESETPAPGAMTGGLFQVRSGGRIRELADDELTLPAGVDTGPFGRIFRSSPASTRC